MVGSGGRVPSDSNHAEEGAALALLLADSSDAFYRGLFDPVGAESRDEGVNLLAITFDDTADEWFDAWRRRSDGSHPGEMTVALVGAQFRSATETPAVQSFDEQTDGAVTIETIESPTDFAAVGALISNYLLDWQSSDAHSVVYLSSLTTLVESASPEKAFQLLSRLRRRFGNEDRVAYVRQDRNRYEEDRLGQFDRLFDVIVTAEEGELVAYESDSRSAEREPGSSFD